MPAFVLTSQGLKRSATPLGRALGGKPGGECHFNCITDPQHVPLARPANADAVKSGFVEKRGAEFRGARGFRKRWFVLSNEHLYWFRKESDVRFTGVVQLLFASFRKELEDGSGSDSGRGNAINLNDMNDDRDFSGKADTGADAADQALDPNDPKALSRYFKIITPVRVFHMRAATGQQANEWLAAFHEVQRKLWEREAELSKAAAQLDDGAGGLTPSGALFAGYLVKRGHNLKKNWKRRYFVLMPNYLSYFSSETSPTPLGTIPLLQCAVKPSDTRPFCLEFVTPSRSVYACAESVEEFGEWTTKINEQIAVTLDRFFEKDDNHATADDKRVSTLAASEGAGDSGGFSLRGSLDKGPVVGGVLSDDENDSESDSDTLVDPDETDKSSFRLNASPEEQRAAFAELLAEPGNSFCCECDEPDPRWASINLGIFLCIQCSGIHRSLGVHISKVRSLELDQWSAANIDFMHSMGNVRSKQIWEYAIAGDCEASEWTRDVDANNRVFYSNLDGVRAYFEPTPRTTREEKEAWISAKYVKREFADPDILIASTANSSEAIPTSSESTSDAKKAQTSKAGWLYKLPPPGRLKPAWKLRYFVLKRNHLYYYKSDTKSPIPVGVVALATANRVGNGVGDAFSVVPDSPSGVASLQAFVVETPGRSYVMGATNSSDVADWLQCLMSSREYFANSARSSLSLEGPEDRQRSASFADTALQNPLETRRRYTMVLDPKLVTHRGFLFLKTGTINKAYKKRWIVLYRKSLYIYPDAEQPLPLAVIDLGAACKVVCHTKPAKGRYFFRLVTPTSDTLHKFYAEERAEMVGWMKAVKSAVSTASAPKWVKTGVGAEEKLAAEQAVAKSGGGEAPAPSRLSELMNSLEDGSVLATKPSDQPQRYHQLTQVTRPQSDVSFPQRPAAFTSPPAVSSRTSFSGSQNYQTLSAVQVDDGGANQNVGAIKPSSDSSPIYNTVASVIADSDSSPIYQTLTDATKDSETTSPLYQNVGAWAQTGPSATAAADGVRRADVSEAQTSAPVATGDDSGVGNVVGLEGERLGTDSMVQLGTLWTGLDRDIDSLLVTMGDEDAIDQKFGGRSDSISFIFK